MELWRHPNPESTALHHFLQHVNNKHNLSLTDYLSLLRWSADFTAAFWEEVWLFVGITASQPFSVVLPDGAPMFPRPDFFSGSLLNFAENLLFPAGVSVEASSPVVFSVTEQEDSLKSTSWEELREATRKCSNALREFGIRPGQVVAGFVSNHLEALIGMLSVATIGAIWTGISPDNGVSAVLDRLEQIEPAVLLTDNGTIYNGKKWSSQAKNEDIVTKLTKCGLKLVLVIRNVDELPLNLDVLRSQGVQAWEFADFLKNSRDKPLAFEQLPPSHPLYILYSSGTTGLPKAIVHTALGTLIQHKKEHKLQCSMSSQSRMLYYTTTSWMMWHWSVSSLAVGSSVVLYSGSPFKPHGYLSLPKLLSSLKVTHFGTSATYLTTLEANAVKPGETEDLSSLEAIYSTASPLPPSTFSFVYEAFSRKVNLASITGGTDIISLFGAPCPLLPVHVGEIQCAGLGMAISVVDPVSGIAVEPGEPGDLVCTRPFPCQPLTFFGPGGNEKYKASYFERFPGIWHHGDFVRINPATSGLIMLGRSDGVLKPSGVRFGSAEIYNILTRFFSSEVEDAVCVGRRRLQDHDETVCLFLVMKEGAMFNDELKNRICGIIRRELSPRHVPGIVYEAKTGIPKTTNGKKIEVAVKQIISGIAVKTNASVANPETLDWFREWACENP